jgi:hypothetical protein
MGNKTSFVLIEEKTGYNLNENNKEINTNFQLNELATWTTNLQSMSMTNKKKETDSPRLAAAKRGLLPWARAISLAGWTKREIF